jgi:hypothetical protein
MHISLSDALQQVNLEIGHVYECRVGGLFVKVIVGDKYIGPLPAPMVESDVMLDPWTDLPGPSPVRIVKATPAKPLLPDAPIVLDEVISE